MNSAVELKPPMASICSRGVESRKTKAEDPALRKPAGTTSRLPEQALDSFIQLINQSLSLSTQRV